MHINGYKKLTQHNNSIKRALGGLFVLTEYAEIITTKDAMAILGISRNMLYELLHNETIHGFKLGKKIWRLKKSDIIDYLQSN